MPALPSASTSWRTTFAMAGMIGFELNGHASPSELRDGAVARSSLVGATERPLDVVRQSRQQLAGFAHRASPRCPVVRGAARAAPAGFLVPSKHLVPNIDPMRVTRCHHTLLEAPVQPGLDEAAR